jgi:hypothetical protein
MHSQHGAPLKVAIIGGGAAGLAAARALSKQGIRPVVFEKQSDTGGVWNYLTSKKESKKEQPMYRGLRTNLPKEIMAFRELPWTRTVERSYVTHRDVLDYLHDYQQMFDLTQYIQFDCTVQQLTLLPHSCSALRPPSDEIWPQIELQWEQRRERFHPDPSYCQDTFDAVIVCNGHYALPSIPNLPGLGDYFHGNVLHSIEYDDPSEFAGQRVLCVGGRASGSDLAREISKHAKHVYLSDTSCSSPQTFQNITLVPATKSILPTGEVTFEGISDPNLFPKVDTIIFCSGYDYDFPFVNNRQDSNFKLEFARGERRVKPLFEQLWHAVHPNIAFIGLPHSILPFPLFEFQVQAVVHQWTLSKSPASADAMQLPSLSKRLKQAERDANSGGSRAEGRVPKDTHYLGDAQWDYCRRLAQYAGDYNLDTDRYISTNKVSTWSKNVLAECSCQHGGQWNENICLIDREAGDGFDCVAEILFFRSNKAIYDHSSHERKSLFPGGPDYYRETSYQRDEERQSFNIVASSPTSTLPLTQTLVRR